MSDYCSRLAGRPARQPPPSHDISATQRARLASDQPSVDAPHVKHVTTRQLTDLLLPLEPICAQIDGKINK